MNGILTKAQMDRQLKDFYRTAFGQRDTDRWYETAAVNVRAFARDGELISLRCHLLTGEVTATARKM